MIKEYFLIKNNKIQETCLIPDDKLDEVKSNGYIVIERSNPRIPINRLKYDNGAVIELPDYKKEEIELLKYLASTDYLVVRKMETGIDYSQEIKDKRQQARDRISQIRIELGE